MEVLSHRGSAFFLVRSGATAICRRCIKTEADANVTRHARMVMPNEACKLRRNRTVSSFLVRLRKFTLDASNQDPRQHLYICDVPFLYQSLREFNSVHGYNVGIRDA